MCLCVKARWCASRPTTSWTDSAGLCTGETRNTPWPTRTCCCEAASSATRRPATAWLFLQVCVCVCMHVCFKTRESEKSHVTFNASAAPPGPDTKLMQNSGRTKFKRTSIDRLMNTLVLWVGHLKLLTFSHYFGTQSQGFGFHFVYQPQQVYHILVLLSATMQLWGVWM